MILFFLLISSLVPTVYANEPQDTVATCSKSNETADSMINTVAQNFEKAWDSGEKQAKNLAHNAQNASGDLWGATKNLMSTIAVKAEGALHTAMGATGNFLQKAGNWLVAKGKTDDVTSTTA
jgi:hypothetical protein